MGDVIRAEVLKETHAKVKAYAALRGLTVPEAYKILIEKALSSEGFHLQ